MSDDNKYDVKLNPKKPNKEDIKARMDFEGAYKAYTHKVYRTPWSRFQRHASKNNKTMMFIILIIVVGSLLFIEEEESNIPPKDVKTEQVDSLKSPLKLNE